MLKIMINNNEEEKFIREVANKYYKELGIGNENNIHICNIGNGVNIESEK